MKKIELTFLLLLLACLSCQSLKVDERVEQIESTAIFDDSRNIYTVIIDEDTDFCDAMVIEDFEIINDVIENENCNTELGWVVLLKLKSQEDESYVPTEDTEIKDLISKHGVTFEQPFPDKKDMDMFLYYSLHGRCCICMENVIKDFLATGRFEDDVREFEIANVC